MESPPVEPIKEENKAAYDSLVKVWMSRLNKEINFKDKQTFTHPIFPIEVELPDSTDK